MTKLSRYQKLNQRRWEQKQRQKMNGEATISGCNPRHPPGVAAILATQAIDDIDAVQQPAQLDPVETNDVGVPQNDLSCMDGFVAEPRTKGKNIHQNHWHQDARAQEITMFQGNKAKHQNSTIVHLLTHQELELMKDKGSIVVHVTLPIKSSKTKGKPIFWKIVNVSSQNNVFAGPCKQNLLIVTTYDQLSSSNHIRFIGMVSYKPKALLCLVCQQSSSKSAFNHDFFIVNVAKNQCHCAKYNIVSGKATGHHRSHGFIHGFGSWRDMQIDRKTQSSLSKYVVKKGGTSIHEHLEE